MHTYYQQPSLAVFYYHILCRKEITLPRVVKFIALVLLQKVQKVENNVLVVSGNNES